MTPHLIDLGVFAACFGVVHLFADFQARRKSERVWLTDDFVRGMHR